MDPYSDYGFVSTKLLNTNPVWIPIHNTASDTFLNICVEQDCDDASEENFLAEDSFVWVPALTVLFD